MSFYSKSYYSFLGACPGNKPREPGRRVSLKSEEAFTIKQDDLFIPVPVDRIERLVLMENGKIKSVILIIIVKEKKQRF